jgi:hypothetical protein
MKDKKIKFMADMEKEESDFFEKLKADRALGSNRELLKSLRLSLEGKTDVKKPLIACGHLSSDNSLCGKDFKKTNSAKCELCLREKALVEAQRARENEAYFGFYYHDPVETILGLKRVLKLRGDRIEELEKPMLDFITEKDTLNSRCAELKNALLERDDRIAILEPKITQLEEKIKSLSENELLNENDGLHKKIEQLGNSNTDYRLEIDKLIALHEKDAKISTDLLSQMTNMLRDFKENVPVTTEPNALATYINNVMKRIEQFEGHIKTVESF